MSPFYVTKKWNRETERSEYKIVERHWFTLARYLISIGAISKNSNELCESEGIEVNTANLDYDERVKKSKRETIMNDCFDWYYGSGIWSTAWHNWLDNGFIYPRDGFQDYRTDANFLRKWKTFSRAIGNHGYFLTTDGTRKYINALRKIDEYKKDAEHRMAKKILAEKKKLEAKKLDEIKKDF